MPLGKGKKRRKSVYSPRGRRKSYREGLSPKAYNAVRVSLLVLMVLVFAAGVAIPLCSYFANEAKDTQFAYEGEAGEFFTEEQKQELLAVVNKAAPLEEDYVPQLAKAQGVLVNTLVKGSLESMLAKAREDYVNLQVSRGYVSYEEQNQLYEEAYNSLKEQKSVTSIKAEAQTVKSVPKAGESEAQTGLLIVFSDADEENFRKSKSFSWLEDNAADYGFVLRYPENKQDATSMNFNPAAYRFVGQKNALQMRVLDMCLEEFSKYNAIK